MYADYLKIACSQCDVLQQIQNLGRQTDDFKTCGLLLTSDAVCQRQNIKSAPQDGATQPNINCLVSREKTERLKKQHQFTKSIG